MHQKTVQLLGGFLWAIFAFYHPTHAQSSCKSPVSTVDLDVNNVRAKIRTSGDFFNDDNDAGFIYKPTINQAATIYTAGLWMGGTDMSGNPVLAAMTYRVNGESEFAAGPLGPGGQVDAAACTNWDIMFSVAKDQIEAFSDDLTTLVANPQIAISQYPDIMGWPGIDNPHFEEIHGFTLPASTSLAPFFDANEDGIYNPLNGDKPAVLLQGKAPFIPAQITWCVFNDAGTLHYLSGGGVINMEVQFTAWAFSTGDETPFDNSIFTSHKLLYRGTNNISDFRVAFFTDFDLGCYADDYVGCNPEKNYIFCYNQGDTDGQPGIYCPSPTFGTETPVQTSVFLNGNLDNFIYFSDFTLDLPDQFIPLLNGRWGQNVPLTIGGSGYNPNGTPTNHAFPDSPADPNGWSMCTAGINADDFRTVASSALGLLNPGAVNELTLAWTIHPNVPGPCPSMDSIDNNVDIIQNAYDDNFEDLAPLLLVQNTTALVQATPNPARTAVTLHYGELNVLAVRCFDTQGYLVYDNYSPVAGQQTIPVHLWSAGTYVAQLTTDQGLMPVRFVVE